ncbi:hypothetical protein DSO57_1032788 [Entomophthora muscae]|uniref:Uncharacterized protein n=1 Tax=Entomophthora muscae TaxID=34485 RepID=A0ACC2S269_9FUNG|nr:hypothetical protein DSO57_1032788 [Entomophthora muscae]
MIGDHTAGWKRGWLDPGNESSTKISLALSDRIIGLRVTNLLGWNLAGGSSLRFKHKANWNCYQAVLKDEMKNNSSLEGWHKHIKSSFGFNPRYNTFYEHLKVQQGKTVASIRDIENRPSKKKRTTKEK